MASKSCLSCYYYDEPVCRRLSPQAIGRLRFAVWPEITDPEKNWCGEHKAAPLQLPERKPTDGT